MSRPDPTPGTCQDLTRLQARQVDALGRTTTWTLDANSRITARTLQDGSSETSQYDIEGNRLAKRTFAGEQFSFQYNTSNRLTGQIVPQGEGGNSAIPPAAINYAYTPSGQLQSQQEQGTTTLNGTQSHQYDVTDRLLEIKNPLGQINYGLDAAGNITERSVTTAALNAGTSRNEYDAAGRLLKVTAPDGKPTHYSYDPAGRVATVERELNPKDAQPQTLVTYNRYDGADRLIAIAEVKRVGTTETVIAGQALTRATGGTITKIETYRTGSTHDAATGMFSGTPSVTQTFEYDANARLTRETRTQASATTDTAYEYNAVGNRTRKLFTAGSAVETTSYTYDSADRLTQETLTLPAGGTRITAYTWDTNGNLASKTEPSKVTLYRFDPQNRLIDIRVGSTQSEAQAATPSVSYAYDAAGNRVKKSTGTSEIAYLIDSQHNFAQVALETSGPEARSYVRGLQLIRQTKLDGPASEDLFPLQGHLGTSLGAVDANGNLVEEVQSDAFGNLDQSTGLKQAHLYTGEYFDQDNQLLYLRARWYDPKIGRFISADPYEGKQRDPRSLNRYSYAHSDPVHGSDPSGRMTLTGSGIAMVSIAVSSALPVVKHAVLACTAIAVASTMPGFADAVLPGPLQLCQAHRMRVQFQVSPVSGGITLETHAQAIYGLPGIGVRATQVEAVMNGLFMSLPAWWPNSIESPTIGMMARTSIAIRRIVPGGVVGRTYVWKEPHVHNRLEYRIDVENLAGHNLKMF